jgi:hypothetical protein
MIQYENQKKSLSKIAYTHRPRTLDVVQKHLSFFDVPGPGAYDSFELNPKGGRLRLSKYADTKLATTYRDIRFKEIKTATPSP